MRILQRISGTPRASIWKLLTFYFTIFQQALNFFNLKIVIRLINHRPLHFVREIERSTCGYLFLNSQINRFPLPAETLPHSIYCFGNKIYSQLNKRLRKCWVYLYGVRVFTVDTSRSAPPSSYSDVPRRIVRCPVDVSTSQQAYLKEPLSRRQMAATLLGSY